MNNHKTQWQQLKETFLRDKMPQALLLVGPAHCSLNDFANSICHLLLCQAKPATKTPCLDCADCLMTSALQHPDMEWIRPEKTGAGIKIDQIRLLQQSAYLTPQRAKYRLVLIEAVEKMQSVSANALLKILEEPATHTVFILLAEQLSTVLPTVLSRCRLIRLCLADPLIEQNLLNLGKYYSQETDRASILSQAESILEDCIAVLEGQEHPCAIAAKWSNFDFSTILWFLYLVFAQLQRMKHRLELLSGPACQQLLKLSALLSTISIFGQQDKILCLLKQTNSLNLNQSLALEDLLISLVEHKA